MGVEVLAGKWTSGLGLKEEERDQKKIKLACPIKKKNSKISWELKREAVRIDEWGVGKYWGQLCGRRSEAGVSQGDASSGGKGQETSRNRRVSYALTQPSAVLLYVSSLFLTP